MMTRGQLVNRLRHLKSKFRKSAQQWQHESIIAAKYDSTAAPRYEGESIAFRWCAEDLEELLGCVNRARGKRHKESPRKRKASSAGE